MNERRSKRVGTKVGWGSEVVQYELPCEILGSEWQGKFCFFKQKAAYEMLRSLVGSEMCIRDSVQPHQHRYFCPASG